MAYGNRESVLIVQPAPRKSMVVALLLTFFFGPLGLLYSSMLGGLLLSVIELGFLLLTVLTFGLTVHLLTIPWIASMIWAAIAVYRRNTGLR